MADQPVHAAAQLQADLRQLGGLARTGLAGDHHHLMLGDGCLDLLALGGNRQVVIVANRRNAQPARGDLVAGLLVTLQPLRQLERIPRRRARLLAQFQQLPAQSMAVHLQALIKITQQLFEVGGGVSHRMVAGSFAKAAIVADLLGRNPLPMPHG